MSGAGRRLTYANVMSTVAVFLAIGGSAMAVTQINGSRLKDQSVAGKKLKKKTIAANRLKNNSITGRQIKESTLGKVPAASSADLATTANSANTATSATSAATADNALALGGLPPSAYMRAAKSGKAVRCTFRGTGRDSTATCRAVRAKR